MAYSKARRLSQLLGSDGTVPAGKIPADSIDGTKIADNAINSEHYADGSIDTAHIATDQITNALIPDNAIDSEHYTDGSIDTAHIAADQITSALIADDQIDSEHIVDGSIDLAHMSVNSIDSDQYVDGSIDLIHMSANSIDSDQYVDGSIDTAHIADDQITAAKLANTAVTAASYGSTTAIPIITVDAQGRLTSASTAAISTAFTLAADSGTSDTFNTSETLTFAGTTNEVETTVSNNQIQIGLPNNVTISGNLTVSGTQTSVNSTTLAVADPLIELATGNNSTDAVDIGLYGLYDTSGSLDLYGGLFRDASDSGKWNLFKDLQAVPTTTVNKSGTGYAVGTLIANLEGNVTGNVTGNLTGNASGTALTVTQAAQTNITSLGTLSSLSVGAITSTAASTITTADNLAQLTLISTDADSGIGPVLDLKRNPGEAGADSDWLGQVHFTGYNDAGTPEALVYAKITAQITDATDGSEDATVRWYIMEDGGRKESLTLGPTETVINDAGIDKDFRVESDGNANMLFVDGGNDRVGIGTTNPLSKLHVEGSAFIGEGSPYETEFPSSTATLHVHEIVNDADGVDFGNEAHVVISTGAVQTGDQGYQGSLWFGTSDHPAGGGVSGAGGQFVWRNAGIASTSGAADTGTATGYGNLEFYTNNGSSAATERMCILADGKIGMGGQDSPATNLEVIDSGGGNVIAIGTGHADGSVRSYWGYSASGNTTGWHIGSAYNNDAARYDIRMKGGSSSDAKLTVLGSGNVGIGTTSPGKKLDVTVTGNTDGIRVNGNQANTSLIINNTATSGVAWDISSTGGGHGHGNGGLHFGVAFDTPKVTFKSDGKVGIGTYSPENLLHVKASDVGSAPIDTALLVLEKSGTNYLNFMGANTNVQGILFGDADNNDQAKIVYDHSDDKMQFVVNNAERFRIRDNGYVDIAGASDLRLTLGSQGTAGNNDSNWIRGDGTNIAYNSASDDHVWEIGGNEHMRMDANASASVGHLQLKDAHPWIDMIAPDGSTFKAGITARGGSSSTQAQFHLHIARDAAYKKISTAENYDTYLTTENSNTANGNLIFGTSLTERMRVHAANGFIGIGNTAPIAPLMVQGDGASGQFTALALRHDDSNGDNNTNMTCDIDFYLWDGNTRINTPQGRIGLSSIDVGSQALEASGTLSFYTTNASYPSPTLYERLRINNDGRQTYNASSTKNGHANFVGEVGNSSKAIMFEHTNGGGEVGKIVTTSSTVALSSTSDYRLKENVDYTWDATTRLKQLKPVRFNWIIDETNTLSDGFLAHEVSDHIPEAVYGEKDGTDEDGNPDYQGIDHSKLVPLLVKTIQELEARIATLEG